MASAAQVQYIRFAVDGTAARKMESKPAPKKTVASRKHKAKCKCIYIDPVAIFSIAVALCMFVMMGVGLVRYNKQQEKVERMEAYVNQLQAENEVLEKEYLDSYDAEEVEHTAMALGMVHKGQNQTVSLEVERPVQEEEVTVTLMDRIGTFLTSLFA